MVNMTAQGPITWRNKMLVAPLSEDEGSRLRALYDYDSLDGEAENGVADLPPDRLTNLPDAHSLNQF